MVAVENSIPAQVDKVLSSGSFGDNKSLTFNVRTLYAGIQKIVDKVLDVSFDSKMFSSLPVSQVLTRATLDETFVLIKNRDFEEAKQKIDFLEKCFASFTSEQGNEAAIFPDHKLYPLSNLSCNEFLMGIVCRVKDALVRDGFTDKIEFIEPTEFHYKSIEDGQSLLGQLVPHTAHSTLSLVRCLLLVDGAIGSAYFNETPFMYIVGKSRLNDPLQIADTLLHEALHQKMADIRLTRRILCEEYNDLESTASKDLLIPWGASSPRIFSVSLGLAAYHFYVHSVLVHASALEHLSSSVLMHNIAAEEVSERLLLSFKRAAFLETSLRSDIVQSKMGSDGIQFLTWMGDAMIQLREMSLLNKTKLGEQELIEMR
jgi:hypothetical protein